jgi:hypothetical protein
MQYFGYLRRNPNDAPEPGLNFDGYNFWLTKLNHFDGNFINAEMVNGIFVILLLIVFLLTVEMLRWNMQRGSI